MGKVKPHILLAVSGGIDSMVMLHRLLHEYGPENLAVAHCNFNLRGAESDADQAFVLAQCKALNVHCHAQSFDTKAFISKQKLSTQEAARNLRYDWFHSLMTEHNYSQLAIGHHADDSSETFLINLLRGTGLKGLMGIKDNSSRHITRPLLTMTRCDVKDYAVANNIEWREDSSNASDAYLRNRVRNELIPLMHDLRDSFPGSMIDTIKHLRMSQMFIEAQFEKLSKDCITETKDSTHFSIAAIGQMNQALLFLHHVLQPHGFRFSQLEDLLVSERVGANIETKTHRLVRDREAFILSEKDKSPQKTWQLDLEGADIDCPVNISRVTVDQVKLDRQDKQVVYMDADKLDFPLTLRLWQKGDRMHPLGMQGRKKISDILIDAKVPAHQKDKSYVLVSNDEIVWAVGFRMSEKAKVTEESSSIILVSQGQ